MAPKKNVQVPAVAIAEQLLQEVRDRLAKAQADHATATARHQELQAEAVRINQELIDGGGNVTEDQIMDARHRTSAAKTLADAKASAVVQLGVQLTHAEGVLIAEQIRSQAGGYASFGKIQAETMAATERFITELDTIADKAEESNAFVFHAIETLKRIDGGHYSGGEEIGGIRRVHVGINQVIEIDGERVTPTPATAVFETAAEDIQAAGIASIRYQRQLAAAA